MSIFKRKKQSEATEKTVLETNVVGTELHVNPPPDVTLTRLEARLERVKSFLVSNVVEPNSSKEKEMRETQRRLELQIKVHKGDY